MIIIAIIVLIILVVVILVVTGGFGNFRESVDSCEVIGGACEEGPECGENAFGKPRKELKGGKCDPVTVFEPRTVDVPGETVNYEIPVEKERICCSRT